MTSFHQKCILATKTILAQDEHDLSNGTVYREVMTKFLQYPPVLPTQDNLAACLSGHNQLNWSTSIDWDEDFAEFTEERLENGIIYTDGEWSNPGSDPINFIFRIPDQASIKASSAIVLMSQSENWLEEGNTTAIRLVGGNDINAKHAFVTELLGINCALSICHHRNAHNVDIRTDCLSVKKILGNPGKLRKLTNKPELGLIQSALDDIYKLTPCITHVKAHTGEDLAQALWTRDIWGNHIADRVAAGDYVYLNSIGVTVKELHYSVLLKDLTLRNKWHWETDSGLLTERPGNLLVNTSTLGTTTG